MSVEAPRLPAANAVVVSENAGVCHSTLGIGR
jgi:hypothetical protein